MMKRALIVAVTAISLMCFGMGFALHAVEGGSKDAESRHERMIQRLVDRLGVTEDVAEEILAIFAQTRETNKELFQQIRDMMGQLRDELAKEAPDDDVIAGLIALLDARRDQIAANREAGRDEIFELLTVEQQGRFVLMNARMHGKMRGPKGLGKEVMDEMPGGPCRMLP